MQELFERELDQHAGRGRLVLSAAALAGIADVVGRRLHERVSEERRNFIEGDRMLVRQVTVAFVAALVVVETVRAIVERVAIVLLLDPEVQPIHTLVV
jgi:hypothetical protein